jgi:mannose-6-phosphate isomerase-like protein (cupin superfamily)
MTSFKTYVSAAAAIATLLCLTASAQAPAPGKDAEKGYAPTRLWERPDVRATRVEIQPHATRAVHQHDDVKFHLFIPLSGTLQLTIGSDKPVDAPVGQAFYIKGGTPHGFRNLGATKGMVMEIFVKDGSSKASLDGLGALVAALRSSPPQP